MSTFAKATFNAVAYAASRPNYPPALYQEILAYAAPISKNNAVLLDLGCGPGTAATNPILIEPFQRIIGIDPSQKMIDAANSNLNQFDKSKNIEFHLGSGEDLSFVEPESIDLVIAAQAAHWFDLPKVYEELEKVLKSKGSFVFWGYGDVFLPNNPQASKIIKDFSHKTLSDYWEEPGRSRVSALLLPLLPPISSAFAATSFKRIFHINDSILLKKEWSLDEIINYVSSWSSVHSYTLKHAGENIVEDMLRKDLKAVGVGEKKVEVNWPTGMMMGKKL